MSDERPHGQGDGREPDPFEGLVLDEDFIRGARQREQSGRARMLEARWRVEPPRNTGFREAADRAWHHPGARAHLSPRDPCRTRRRVVRFGLVWIAVVVALLVVVTADPDFARDLFDGSNNRGMPGDSSPMTAQPPVSGIASGAASPSAAPALVDPDRPTRQNPFAGSPALHYSDGAAGIVLPEVKTVPGYTPRQVRNALDATKKLLVEGNLNPATTMGSDPRAYLAPIDPAHEAHTELPKALTARGGEALSWVTRFDPREIELVGPVVKVSGIIAYSLTGERVLSVHADYSFVYAVAKAGSGPDGEVTRVVVRRALEVWFIGKDVTEYVPTPEGTVWLNDRSYELANSSCERNDGFVRPEFPGDSIRSSPSGPPEDPYDRSDALLAPESSPSPGGAADPRECGTASRI